MNISEELDRLDQLRQRGVLSEDEFARAKARLIDGHHHLPLLDSFLNHKFLKMKDVVQSLQHCAIPAADSRRFRNVNTPTDLAAR